MLGGQLTQELLLYKYCPPPQTGAAATQLPVQLLYCPEGQAPTGTAIVPQGPQLRLAVPPELSLLSVNVLWFVPLTQSPYTQAQLLL